MKLLNLMLVIAYKAHIISTIVDDACCACSATTAYKAHIISTIVDDPRDRRSTDAYKAHIISTIVDRGRRRAVLQWPIRLI